MGKVTNDLRIPSDESLISIPVLMDLFAAFDTINHNILENKLALKEPGWFKVPFIRKIPICIHMMSAPCTLNLV